MYFLHTREAYHCRTGTGSNVNPVNAGFEPTVQEFSETFSPPTNPRTRSARKDSVKKQQTIQKMLKPLLAIQPLRMYSR